MSKSGGSPLHAGAAPDTAETPRQAPSRLVLVRHGESTWNHERRIQGQLDPPLSDRGHDQAHELAERLAGTGISAVYSSDLSRTRQTAEPLTELIGLEPQMLPSLREVALGAWEGKTREQLVAEYPAEWERWSASPSWDVVPGGEGTGPFRARVEEVIGSLLERPAAGDVVVITHGGVIQVALAMVVGQSLHGLFPYLIDNGSISVLQRSGERTVITAVNDTCHLS